MRKSGEDGGTVFPDQTAARPSPFPERAAAPSGGRAPQILAEKTPYSLVTTGMTMGLRRVVLKR